MSTIRRLQLSSKGADPALTKRLPPPLAPSRDFDVRELGRMLWRRKAVIIGTVVMLTTLALIVIQQITPRYTAVAHVLVGGREAQVLNVEAVLSGLPSDSATIWTEIQVIRSRKLADKTIERLGLDRDPEFNKSLQLPGPFRSLFDYVFEAWLAPVFGSTEVEGSIIEADKLPQESASTDMEFLENSQIPDIDDPVGQAGKLEQERARTVTEFLANLEVSPEGISRVIKIAFEAENPRTAAEVANTLADFYIVAQLEAKFDATKHASDWLRERLAKLREQVLASERAVEEFRTQSGLLQGRDVTLATEEVSEVNAQLVQVRLQRAEADARLRQVEALLDSTGGADAAPEVIDSALIQSLRQRQVDAERRAAELSAQFKENYPMIVNVRAEIREIQATIATEIKRIIGGIRSQVAVAKAREASLSARLTELKQHVGELNTAAVQLRALEREAEANRTVLEAFLTRFKETSSQEDFQQADASILSLAPVPERPSFPKRRIVLVITFVGASFLGVLLALFIEQLDHGFRSTQQVEELMGVATLGLVPALNGKARIGGRPEAYVLEKPASAYGESIRRLHTGLLLCDVDRPPKVILIASSLPKEGKTSVALSLARLLANIGQKVIVVDCDLRKPSAHKIFGVSSRPGLVDCLAGEASLDKTIQQDCKSEAHILPAGRSAPSPPDLLGSEEMKKLLKALAERYDLVVVDSAPVHAVSDTLVLPRLVDKTVFLIRWRHTRREAAMGGLKQIVEAGGDVAGVILTIVDIRRHARYGYSDSGLYDSRIRKYYTG